LVDSGVPVANDFDAIPHHEGFYPGAMGTTSLLAPIYPDLHNWQRSTTDQILAKIPLQDGKKKQSAKLLKERESH
jgi:hypothetical protein